VFIKADIKIVPYCVVSLAKVSILFSTFSLSKTILVISSAYLWISNTP